MRSGKLIIAVLTVATAVACSTITRGTTQAVAIHTPGVEKAECELQSEGIGNKTVVTPATIVLDKSMHDVQVTCRKKCYTDGKGVISSMTEEMTAAISLSAALSALRWTHRAVR
jgi:hypothetical protein